jgi:tRNA modification GTPase
MASTDTIYALSSGRLPAGVAVVRISGPRTRFVIETICGRLGEERRATYCTFRSRDGEIIDRGLLTFFAGPKSFTGEDCAEFGLHGGRAVVAKLLEALGGFGGVRMAEAGEFTRRAMLDGKVDLVQAEALADLIGAETEAQRRFATANADGRQSTLYEEWRSRIIFGRAMLEAELDFSDEGDVPGSVSENVWSELAGLATSIERHAAGFKHAEIIRDGFRVVILGAPNAGKSSLLNALAKRDVAIVTEEPGTTRDLVEVALDIDGMKVMVTDTAGIREGASRVEQMGIERALSSAGMADLVLALSALDEQGKDVPAFGSAETLRVGSKLDLLPGDERVVVCPDFDLLVSSTTGEGLDALMEKIGSRAAIAAGAVGEVLPFRARHIEMLARAAAGLRSAVDYADGELELRAEELRRASDALGRITGAVDAEDLLDVIFSEFCIGK